MLAIRTRALAVVGLVVVTLALHFDDLQRVTNWMGVESVALASTSNAHLDAPVVTNPGGQTSAVTESYGYAGTVLAGNPVAYYRLEDYVGTSAADWAATPQVGTISGTPLRGQAGALGDGSVAMGFVGEAGSHVDITETSVLDLPSIVTVEAWVNPGDAAANGAIFDRRTNDGTAYRLMEESGYWIFRVQGSFGYIDARTTVVSTDVGAWLHLVGTFMARQPRSTRTGP